MSKNVKSPGSSPKTLLGAQIRAARALLRWSAADLVRESGVSHATIHRAETVNGRTAMTFANAIAIRRALESGWRRIARRKWGWARCSFQETSVRLTSGCTGSTCLQASIRRLIETALTTKSKRQSSRGRLSALSESSWLEIGALRKCVTLVARPSSLKRLH